MSPPLEFDASFGEGGGSILRVAVGLAVVTNQTLHIYNIRKSRPQPGLKTQHMMGVKAIVQLTDGFTTPLEIGTTDLTITPGKSWNHDIQISISTAGNIGLLTQTLHNALYHAPSGEYLIRVKGGGTFGTFAPSPIYLNHVTFELFRKMGYNVEIQVQQQGFFPKGGAIANIRINPGNQFYKSLNLIERGDLIAIQGEIHVHEQLKQAQVGERIASSVITNTKKEFLHGILPKFTIFYDPSLSIGVGVDIWCEFSSGSRVGIGTELGERGVSSEKVGERCAHKLNHLLSIPATIDEYASDQLLPLMCLAEGSSQILVEKISSHCQTNLLVLEKFFNRKYKIERTDRGTILSYL
jgi:RNA 3'-terminal phosphate cyclase (ATP)